MSKISVETTLENQIQKQWVSPNKYFFNCLRKRELGILIGAQIVLFCAIYSMSNFYPYLYDIHLIKSDTIIGQITSVVLISLLIFQLLFLIYIVNLFLKYKPIPSVCNDSLPDCTVIVPAYNEGELVYQTLKSIVQSDYPKEKLEIIAVDDGSKDNTLFWMEKAKTDFGSIINIFKQPENRGKRQALYQGFHNSKGSVFVTIDSDSVVEQNTLRNLVSPFILDENCGAIAGNVKVLNKKQGIIPKMLNVSFVFSFEFIRSAQSSLGFVLCTPGALSAYRKVAVMNCLDEWINQKFIGKTATIGEDRAMTNLILKQGFDVKFQKNANVLTSSPITYKNLHKMFTRWGRSNVRETWMMNQFIFKNFRQNNKLGARLIFINQCIKLILAIPFTVLMFYFLFSHPLLYLSSTLTSTFIFSSIQMLFFSRQYNFVEALWIYPYSIFYLFALFWITPFSIVTVKNGGWLTR